MLDYQLTELLVEVVAGPWKLSCISRARRATRGTP